jgi:hypothetical protein
MPPKAPSDSADGSESKLLEYDPVHGEWCLWNDTCVTSHLVEPVGLKSDEFEIVHITNFNGEFVGGGMPEYGGGLAPGELPPDFKRAEKPEPPAAPELLEENYSTEEFAPEYAQECKFDELFTYPKPFAWDTIKDKYGEEEIKYTYQHETDDDGKSTAAEMGLPPEHPCRVAAETGGLFDAKFSGDKDGDGETHDELGYDALFGCTPRKRKRTKTVEEVEAASDEYEEHAGKILKAVKSACSIAPATGIEPFGFGITIEIPKICSSIAEVTKVIADWIHSAVTRKQMTDIATASQSDCDTTQAGLARLVCDVHCVRDAVLRGDLNLRRIMSKATHLTNQNLKNFAEWGVDSMNSRTDWLAAKIDDLEVILGTKIDGVAAKVLVQKASRDIGVMLQEMQTYAQQAETDTATRVIARRALSKFVASAEGEHASAPGNMSQVISVLKEVTSLHAVLKVSGQTSRRDAARVMLTEGVQHMQRIAKESLATIGIYKHHSMSTKRQVREWTATRAAGALILIELDKVWWHIRNQMDDFIEVAEGHVWSFTHAFDALAGYRECTSGFSQLLSAYNGAMAAREASHQKLHETWRATSSMFEELASMIVDADVFTNFMTQEGCDSSLASQTLHQAMLSVGAMGLLMDRYDAGGLPSPDVEPVRVALARIRNSFNASQRACNEM